MLIASINLEDFVNYKKPSMFIGFPSCTFKCEKECGIKCCQNSPLATSKRIDVGNNEIISLYLKSNITSAFVFGGLEPFDTWDDMLSLIDTIRNNKIEDDIVIYTGYLENEISDFVDVLKMYKNIIIKFGRYVPNDAGVYDDILGVTLASKNQYAKRIS